MVGPSLLAPLLRTTFAATRLDELTDGELLARYVAARDGEAFAELVRRLGPTVYGVCRRVLGSAEDAEDAFQVAFLVLARKAGTVRPPGRVAAWLHGVAAFVAHKARTARGRRRTHESAAPPSEPPAPPEPDLGGVIDEELNRLPDQFRLPVVLCAVRGLTIARAARELGWPAGTVASRLSRGRATLAARLARRGVTVGAIGGLTVAPPARLAAAALSLTTPGGAAPSAATSLLLREVTRAMTTTRLTVRLLAAGLLAAAVTGLTTGVGGLPPAPAAPVPVAAVPPEKVLDRVPLGDLATLLASDAVRKDLDLSDEQAKEVANALAGLVKAVADAAKGAPAARAFVNGVAAGGMKVFPNGGKGKPTLEEACEEAGKKFDKVVLKALTPEQVRRLKQISLQAMGPAALLDLRAVRALALSAEQEDEILASLPRPPKVTLMLGLKGGPSPDDPKAVERVDAAWAAAVKTLTPDQRKKWDAMIGKPLPTDLPHGKWAVS